MSATKKSVNVVLEAMPVVYCEGGRQSPFTDFRPVGQEPEPVVCVLGVVCVYPLVPVPPPVVVVQGWEVFELETQIPPLVGLQTHPGIQLTPAQGSAPTVGLATQAPL